MTLVQDNLRIIQKRFPEAIECFRGIQGSVAEMKNLSGQISIRVDGKFLCDPYDPWQQARVFAKDVLGRTTSGKSVLVLGFGAGYHLQALLEQGMQVGVVELNPVVLKTACLYRDLTGVLNSVQLFLSDSANNIFQSPDYWQFLSQRPIVVPFSPSLQFNDQYRRLLSSEAGADLPAKTRAQQRLLSLKQGSAGVSYGAHPEDALVGLLGEIGAQAR